MQIKRVVYRMRKRGEHDVYLRCCRMSSEREDFQAVESFIKNILTCPDETSSIEMELYKEPGKEPEIQLEFHDSDGVEWIMFGIQEEPLVYSDEYLLELLGNGESMEHVARRIWWNEMEF